MPDLLRCFSCGATWIQRQANPPIRCPRCQCRKWYLPTLSRPLTASAIERISHALDSPPPLTSDGIPTQTDPGPLPEREDV